MMPIKRSRFSPRWFFAGIPPQTLSIPNPHNSSFCLDATFGLLASSPEGKVCRGWSSTVDEFEYLTPSTSAAKIKYVG